MGYLKQSKMLNVLMGITKIEFNSAVYLTDNVISLFLFYLKKIYSGMKTIQKRKSKMKNKEKNRLALEKNK